MGQYYTTGQFAEMAKVTIRTIRYYDKRGLLKPTYVNEAGYRFYTDQDFAKLQKILVLKNLGFSLDEITNMTINDDVEHILDSLNLQATLVQKRIEHLKLLEKSLKDTIELIEQQGQFEWNEIINLIHLTNLEEQLGNQYRNEMNLKVRIALHSKYSTNPQKWFSWLYQLIDFSNARDILEIGCGNGDLWLDAKKTDIKDKNICLSDISNGMITDAKKNLKKCEGLQNVAIKFSCMDIQALLFPKEAMDLVIANHVLFYAKSVDQAISEIYRVLRKNGVFYCSTYGKKHMHEITDLVKEFDSEITLSEWPLYELFGIENGKEMLEKKFKNVQFIPYRDELVVNDPKPLVDYILSCHGNQNDRLRKRQLDFKMFVARKMQKQGEFHITKEAGVFICKK